MINVEQLEQFLIAAELLNFSQTAQVFHASASTVSRNISLLEKQVGAQLFLRHDRSLSLTYAGQILLRNGQRLLDELRELEAQVRSAGAGQAGSLTIVTQNIGNDPILDFIAAFRERYPDIDVQTSYHSPLRIFQKIDTGVADLAVTFGYAVPEDFTDYDTYALHQDEMCILAPESHPLADRRSVSVAELRHQKVLWIRQHEYGSIFTFAEQILERIVPDYSRARNAAMPMLLQDLFMKLRIENCLAAVPKQLCFEFTGGVVQLDIEGLDTRFDMIALWKTGNQNPSLQVFLDEMFRAFP